MRIRRQARGSRLLRTAGSSIALLVALTGCGALGAPAPTPTGPASTESPSISSEPTASSIETPTTASTASPGASSPLASSSPGSSVTPSGSTSPTPTIDPSTGERQLGLADFFNPGPNWSEGRFAIPVVGEVTGIGSETDNCEKDEAIQLEFRNDTQYKTLSLMAGPSKTTADSSKKLVVAVYNNENLIDSVTIPYGEVAPLKGVKIQTVSALKIRMYLDDVKGCNTNGVAGVLYDIRVR